MNNHVNAVCKSIHYHIRALRHIRSSISEDMAKMVACALVSTLTTLILFYLEPLRKTSPNSEKPRTSSPVLLPVLLNPAVHVLSSSSSTGSIKHRIDFKIANITFRTLHCSQPAYLRSSLHACHSTRSLRLSNTNLLSAPFVRTSFGSRSFSVAAPKIWNSLFLSLRTCTSPDTFRRHLKTHYGQHST